MRLAHTLILALLSILFAESNVVRAASITYSFFGTLAESYDGSNAVIGDFVFDPTTLSVSGFDFITPVGNLNPNNYTALVWTCGSVDYPCDVNGVDGGDFVLLQFVSNEFDYDNLTLWFPASLSSSTATPLFTDGSIGNQGSVKIPTPSQLTCDSFEGSPQDCAGAEMQGNVFTSGIAVPTAVPESSSLLVPSIRFGLLGLGVFWVARRRRLA